MEFLIAVGCGVAALAAMYAVLVLPAEIRFVRDLKRMSRLELEAMAFNYADEYFQFISQDHADVQSFRALVAQRDVQELRRNWPRLNRSFVHLETKAGHKGRPLIMDYYHWQDKVLRELARRERLDQLERSRRPTGGV